MIHAACSILLSAFSADVARLPAALDVHAEGYDAYILSAELGSPDGLALSPDGVLYVAEEGAGRISMITDDGTILTLLDGLDSPEGICLGPDGSLYVTEDTGSGSVLRLTRENGVMLVAEASAPEGVAVMSDGSVCFTESTLQNASTPLELRTWVSIVSGQDEPLSIFIMRYITSFSDVTVGQDGTIYVANEIASPGSGPSVFEVDPVSGSGRVFCTGPGFCEGLALQPDGSFPLLVTQEGMAGEDAVLWKVESDGTASVLATGFQNLEGVAVTEDGCIFLSDDAAGSVILLVPQSGDGVVRQTLDL